MMPQAPTHLVAQLCTAIALSIYLPGLLALCCSISASNKDSMGEDLSFYPATSRSSAQVQLLANASKALYQATNVPFKRLQKKWHGAEPMPLETNAAFLLSPSVATPSWRWYRQNQSYWKALGANQRCV